MIDFAVLLAKPSLVASRTFLQCILQISTSFKSTLKHVATIRVSSLFLKLLFKTCVACNMPGAMQKIRMPEVGRHTQSQMSHICSKITKFAGMSISSLPHCLWPSNLAGGVLPCHEELPLIKLLDPSMSHDIKCFISPLALDQWPRNMAKHWLFHVRVFHP